MRTLSVWLVLLAFLRLFSVWFSLLEPDTMRIAFYARMTDVHARTFGTWTLLTCTLLFMSGIHLQNRPLYILTLLSLVSAIAHFVTEYFIYQTIPFCALVTPLLFSGTTVAWMLLEWDASGSTKENRRSPRLLHTRVLSKKVAKPDL